MTRGSTSTGPARQRVAVIGSGVSGLTAAYLLQRRFDVTMYESDDRLGGHAHTHDVVSPDGDVLAVDSGFIVHNSRTYPTLLRLFAELDVATQPTEMSMSIRCEGCGLEYAGARGLRGLFAQPRSLVRPAYLKMLLEVKRFHRQAARLLAAGDDDRTLADFLTAGRFSAYFVRHFMVPVVSCVWSSSPGDALDYPARYLFAFLDNHGMLSVTGTPQWRTVVGGSRVYVERAAKELSAVHLGTPVRAVRRTDSGVDVHDDDGGVAHFDRVVVATHADTALGLLAEPTAAERTVLGAFRYTRNQTVLHTDDRILPAARHARASWNYLMPTCATSSDDVLVSYDMNRLQRLGTATPYVVTLNPTDRIRPDTVAERMTYHHPTYTLASVAAQRRLPELNDDRIAFAGSYHGWGFHEDGARAGADAARSFGVTWDAAP
jgi:predicted NAD/FAD-binding protein